QESAASAAPILDKHAAGTTIAAEEVDAELKQYVAATGTLTARTWAALASADRRLGDKLRGLDDWSSLSTDQRKAMRTDIYRVSATVAKLAKGKKISDAEELSVLVGAHGKKGLTAHLDKATQFIPPWVKIAVALALGLGTMIGWKRIVVTVGEK